MQKQCIILIISLCQLTLTRITHQVSRAFGLNLFTLFHNDILGNEHLFTKVFLFYHKNGNPARRIPIFKNVGFTQCNHIFSESDFCFPFFLSFLFLKILRTTIKAATHTITTGTRRLALRCALFSNAALCSAAAFCTRRI